MTTPTKELINKLTSQKQVTCISLYMPTHRSHPENEQDPIRFQNLLVQLHSTLSSKYSKTEVNAYLSPFENLKDDKNIWNRNLDGLALFRSNEIFELVAIPVPVSELLVIADSFHTKPIRKYLQTEDRFQILGLSYGKIKLFEGNRYSISEIELGNNIPKTMEEALGSELTEKHSTVASYGGIGEQSGNMHHGHGSKNEEAAIDAERFFKIVSETIHENFSKPSGLPLILAALPEHHSLFKKVNHNHHLLPDGITINPEDKSLEGLRKKAWDIISPSYNQKMKAWSAKVRQAVADQKGSTFPDEIFTVASSGRVETLLLEEGRFVSAKTVLKNNISVDTEEDLNSYTDDLLDDIGEIVEEYGGKVFVLPAEKMPVTTGIAAIYRY